MVIAGENKDSFHECFRTTDYVKMVLLHAFIVINKRKGGWELVL